MLLSPPTGFPVTTITVLFVTYCLVQVIKEQERRQALIEDPDPVSPDATTGGPPAAAAAPVDAQPESETNKQKAE